MKNFQQKSLDTDQKDRKLNAPSVTDYMVRKLITFKPETEISVVIKSLLENRITGALIFVAEGTNETVGAGMII